MNALKQHLQGLYVITDPTLITDADLETKVSAALQGGAKIVQYRNKRASYAKQLAQAKALLKLTHAHNACLLINDSVKLCLEANADGVHLGQTDGLSNETRTLLKGKILGVTCHSSIALAEQAKEIGADYCAFGAIYPSSTKPEAKPCSLDVLKQASTLGLPICAIGGIEAHNARPILKHGADMLAVISGVFGKTSIRQEASALSSLFNT